MAPNPNDRYIELSKVAYAELAMKMEAVERWHGVTAEGKKGLVFFVFGSEVGVMRKLVIGHEG